LGQRVEGETVSKKLRAKIQDRGPDVGKKSGGPKTGISEKSTQKIKKTEKVGTGNGFNEGLCGP